MNHHSLSRREFIRRSVVGLASAGAMLGGGWAAAQQAAPETRNQKDTMRYRLLKRSNLMISELSMGGQFLTAAVFSAALDKGVNFVHVSVEYPKCFDEASQVLKERRKDVFLGLKGRPGGLVSAQELDSWLKALNTDHVDFLFIPAHLPDIPRDADGRLRAEFESIKKAGKARFLGVTCHDQVVEVSRVAVETGYYDAIMPRYGAALRPELKPILDLAHEKGVGVFAMKSMQAAGGRPKWVGSLQAALEHPGMTSVLKSLMDFAMLNEFAEGVVNRADKQAQLEYERHVAANAGASCGMCSACSGCPQGVAIEDTLRCAYYYAQELGQPEYARYVYESIPAEHTVLACADCGRCEAVCKHRLPVRHMLKVAHRMLT